MTITRRRFAQLGMGTALSVGSKWLLAQGLSTHSAKPLPRSAPSGRPFHARFGDVGQDVGLRAPIIYGGTEQKKDLVEATGCGWACFECGNDGLLEIFIFWGARLDGVPDV